MYDFVSEKTEYKPEDVPYFEDATVANGWQGQTTGKSIDTLKSEIIFHISKLGGMVTAFEKGNFGTARAGFRVRYAIETPEGRHVPGFIDVAALPVRPKPQYDRRNRTPESVRVDKALRMALYNVAECLGALWKLQRLSPGFAPLMPFMIMDKSGHNLTQLWSESSNMKALMPPAEDDFKTNGNVIDGEIKEI